MKPAADTSLTPENAGPVASQLLHNAYDHTSGLEDTGPPIDYEPNDYFFQDIVPAARQVENRETLRAFALVPNNTGSGAPTMLRVFDLLIDHFPINHSITEHYLSKHPDDAVVVAIPTHNNILLELPKEYYYKDDYVLQIPKEALYYTDYILTNVDYNQILPEYLRLLDPAIQKLLPEGCKVALIGEIDVSGPNSETAIVSLMLDKLDTITGGRVRDRLHKLPPGEDYCVFWNCPICSLVEVTNDLISQNKIPLSLLGASVEVFLGERLDSPFHKEHNEMRFLNEAVEIMEWMSAADIMSMSYPNNNNNNATVKEEEKEEN